MAESILASMHGEVVLTDIAPPPTRAVSGPTVPMDHVIRTKVCGPIALAVTHVQGHTGRGTVREQGLARALQHQDSGDEYGEGFVHFEMLGSFQPGQ